ncbi:MAG: P1 family peptidase, partial [Hyphomicrobium sp.]
QSWLAEHGVGFAIRSARVPLVPQAVLFDLLNGGNKAWGSSPPYEGMGRMACETASVDFALGSAGAGFGATTARTRGGLGSASQTLDRGLVVGALAAVNPVGSPTIGDTPHFWAAPFEVGNEFGGHGFPNPLPPGALEPRLKGGPQEATTIAIVATNAKLSTREAHRLAVMAQTGLARAIYPVHTPLDGDVVFAVATGEVELDDPVLGLARLGTAAANVLARAVARGVYEAAPAPGYWAGPPAYRTLFPPRR